MANPPRHFMARTSCVIKSSSKEWDYEKDTINSLNSHPQLRSLGYLNALHGFVHDIEEYRQPSWRMLADMLLAARVYENGNSNSEECR